MEGRIARLHEDERHYPLMLLLPAQQQSSSPTSNTNQTIFSVATAVQTQQQALWTAVQQARPGVLAWTKSDASMTTTVVVLVLVLVIILTAMAMSSRQPDAKNESINNALKIKFLACMCKWRVRQRQRRTRVVVPPPPQLWVQQVQRRRPTHQCFPFLLLLRPLARRHWPHHQPLVRQYLARHRPLVRRQRLVLRQHKGIRVLSAIFSE